MYILVILFYLMPMFPSPGMLTITDFINILRHHYKSPIVSV